MIDKDAIRREQIYMGQDGSDAVDALLAEVEAWERTAGTTQSEWQQRAEKAEAQVAKVEAERDDIRSSVQHVIEVGMAATAQVATLRAALPPVDKLLLLADWFDMRDTYQDLPMNDEVQRDLRRWAMRISLATEAPNGK